MYPNNKGVRCSCGARYIAATCGVCGDYITLCMRVADAFPGADSAFMCHACSAAERRKYSEA